MKKVMANDDDYMDDVMEEMLSMVKKMSLERKLFIHLQMADINNWDNGDYNGDIDKLKQEIKYIMDMVNEWVEVGMPK